MWYARCCLLLLLTLLAGCNLFSRSHGYTVSAYIGDEIAAKDIAGWTAIREDNRITLRGAATDGAFHVPAPQVDTIFLTFRVTRAGLPRLTDVWVGKVEGYGVVAPEAAVQLQDWHPYGVISGTLRAQVLHREIHVPFWVDLSEETP